MAGLATTRAWRPGGRLLPTFEIAERAGVGVSPSITWCANLCRDQPVESGGTIDPYEPNRVSGPSRTTGASWAGPRARSRCVPCRRRAEVPAPLVRLFVLGGPHLRFAQLSLTRRCALATNDGFNRMSWPLRAWRHGIAVFRPLVAPARARRRGFRFRVRMLAMPA
jgi:hypothetical protein